MISSGVLACLFRLSNDSMNVERLNTSFEVHTKALRFPINDLREDALQSHVQASSHPMTKAHKRSRLQL